MVRRLAALAAFVAALYPTTPAGADPAVTWTVNLSTVDGDDVNVRYGGGALTSPDLTRTGYLVLAPDDLGRPVNRVRSAVVAKVPPGAVVDVDVRGHLGGADWTEWVPTAGGAALLPRTVSVVQVRIGLIAGPAVSAVRLTADRVPRASDVTIQAAPLTFRVFATREGLVGGTTANGHVIRTRDHFVSFPSGRSLSTQNTGTFTARVCTTSGSRCEYAPVWEVGPWNTRDDYWNPSSVRQNWQTLPQGKPEAQAAFQDGFNGGRDQFGRIVANPAGIDLADGTFWDGVGLADNSFVNVTFLWTGTGPTGTVTTAGDPLNVRASASTGAAVRGLAANHAKVIIECFVRGDTVTGTFGTSNVWDRIGPGHFVADAYVNTGSDNPVAPAC